MGINRGAGTHWVGDGFPVTTLFSYDTQAKDISHFCCLIMRGLLSSSLPIDPEALNNIRTVGLRQSPSCIKVK